MKDKASKLTKPATKVVKIETVPAIRIAYNNKHFYLTAIPGKVLFACARVSRAEENSEKGYQRLLNTQRAKAIAAYLDGGNMIPGSIVVSAQDKARITFNDKTNMLSFCRTDDAFLVIDGQHRLYGAHEARAIVTLPVCIFEHLDIAEEVQYFLDINGTQKGVPRTLQLEIVKFTAPAESDDIIRVSLFDELSKRPESPLCGKMSPTKSVIGKLSHVPFKTAIDPVLRNPLVRAMSLDDKVKLLINFLNGAENALDDADRIDKLTNAIFFQALFSCFEAILNYTRRRFGDVKEESFRKVLAPLAKIDWESHSGTNRVAINNLTREILEAVLDGDGITSDLL